MRSSGALGLSVGFIDLGTCRGTLRPGAIDRDMLGSRGKTKMTDLSRHLHPFAADHKRIMPKGRNAAKIGFNLMPAPDQHRVSGHDPNVHRITRHCRAALHLLDRASVN